MSSCFESYAIHKAVHFRHTENGGNCLVEGNILAKINHFTAKTFCLFEPLRNHISNDHHRSSQQMTRSRACETHRASSCYINCRTWSYTGCYRSMIEGWKN